MEMIAVNLWAGQNLQVLLGGAVTTRELIVGASWTDIYNDGTADDPGSNGGTTSGVTAFDLVPAVPSAACKRHIENIMIYNDDTVAQVVTLRGLVGSTVYRFAKVTLAAGYTMYWSIGAGIVVTDASGRIQSISTTQVAATSLSKLQRAPTDLAALNINTAMATGVCQVLGGLVAPGVHATADVLINVTVAAVAVITWAEIALYKYTPVCNGNLADLTRLGYANVAATFNSTGLKKTTVPLTVPTIAGDNVAVVMGSVAAVTMFQVQGGLADQLQSGRFQTLTARPSTEAGPIAGVLMGAAVVPGTAEVIFN